MEKSVLFFDIDGTILNEITKNIPDSTVKALNEAKAAGHFLFINTGRMVCSLPAELRGLPFDGFLCGCGTCIIQNGKVLFEKLLSRERGREIIDMLKECDLAGVAEGPKDVYFPGYTTRFDMIEMSRGYFQEKGLGFSGYIESADFVYSKMLVCADEKSDLNRFLAFIEKDMEAIDRGGNMYEVVQKGYSKATACEFVMKRLGISKEYSYVFGDSSNDLAMFEYASHTVAMGKHDEVLEPYTEFVTKKVEDDGIEYAMKHYGLI